jgi:hypothetical protein
MLPATRKLETEGKMDKAKRSAHNFAGDLKDAVKNANEKKKPDKNQIFKTSCEQFRKSSAD